MAAGDVPARKAIVVDKAERAGQDSRAGTPYAPNVAKREEVGMEQKKELEKETSGSTLGDDAMRNKILEEHAKKYPEGDPSVRRKNPEKGSLR